MKATFITTNTGRRAYIQKSVRVNGVPKSINVKKLGTLEEIQRREGCANPEAWVRELAAKMTTEERSGKEIVSIDFSSGKEVPMGDMPLRHGGDLLMMRLYNSLGLPDLCHGIVKGSQIKYDLNEILRTLVFSRVLAPGSKTKTYDFAKGYIFPPEFSESDMFRSLSLLAGHVDNIQAGIYKASKNIIKRKERVIYFDCTNYYFEIEDNDKDYVDKETGEVIFGLRKRGKSKENRPNPIVQMGMFMDGDGIPLAFNIFPGNESEQIWLQPLEETLDRKFDLTDFVVSTDSGLASEGNRRYNMAEGRDYICVQSLPSLKAKDQDMALGKKGWRVAYCEDINRIDRLPTDDSERIIFNLDKLIEEETRIPGLLKDITFYREIVVEKTFKYTNPQWLGMEKLDKRGKHKDSDGNPIPKELSVKRKERIIVTYNHDYALYLKHKREERLKTSRAIVKNKDEKGRHSQQSPRKYVKTIHRTKDGNIASKIEMVIDDEAIKEEEKFDGFYAYGTSLEDEAIDILKARLLHHEIEHLFRTTKTFLDARPVYLSRPDRIKSHFLICFIAMVILKIMQKQINEANPKEYKNTPLSIDNLIQTLQNFTFRDQMKHGYSPCYQRTPLTDQLQRLANVTFNTQIITPAKMQAAYKTLNKC